MRNDFKHKNREFTSVLNIFFIQKLVVIINEYTDILQKIGF